MPRLDLRLQRRHACRLVSQHAFQAGEHRPQARVAALHRVRLGTQAVQRSARCHGGRLALRHARPQSLDLPQRSVPALLGERLLPQAVQQLPVLGCSLLRQAHRFPLHLRLLRRQLGGLCRGRRQLLLPLDQLELCVGVARLQSKRKQMNEKVSRHSRRGTASPHT